MEIKDVQAKNVKLFFKKFRSKGRMKRNLLQRWETHIWSPPPTAFGFEGFLFLFICFLKMGDTYRRETKIIEIAREIMKYVKVQSWLYTGSVLAFPPREERMSANRKVFSQRGKNLREIIFAILFSLRTGKHVYLLIIGGMVIGLKRTIKF